MSNPVKTMKTKQIVITIIIFISVARCFGQKSKTFYIVNGKDNNLFAQIFFSDNGSPADTVYVLQGRDAAYMHIINVISVKQGKYNEMRTLLTKAIEVCKEDVGTTYHIGTNTMTLASVIGIEVLYLANDNINGMLSLRPDQLERMRRRLDKFALKQ